MHAAREPPAGKERREGAAHHGPRERERDEGDGENPQEQEEQPPHVYPHHAAPVGPAEETDRAEGNLGDAPPAEDVYENGDRHRGQREEVEGFRKFMDIARPVERPTTASRPAHRSLRLLLRYRTSA